MRHYKAVFSFKGSRFLGWQKQKDFRPTVQDEIEKALRSIFKTFDIKTVGSGRTDAGVHSLAHVVKIEAPFEIDPAALTRALNSLLPEDVLALGAEFCAAEFRPTNDALKKEYKYLFTNNRHSSPFQKGLVANYPFELDFDLMKRACALFVGKKDFAGFSCKGSNPASTVRDVYECELRANLPAQMEEIIPSYHCMRIAGNGFLKQMVRLIMGTVWQAGRGKITLAELEEALERGSEKRLGMVAPAEGLYKVKTWY